MPHANRIGWWLACLLVGCLLAAGGASAQRVEGDTARAEGLYEAEVQVYSQREGERRSGFGRGLGQVLAKLSGDGAVLERPGVAQELRRAEDYVEHFDYRQDEGTSASGAPTFHTTLVVRYDREAVEAMAAALGLPVWPEPRPRPVLWLAIDDGRGARLVTLNQNNAVRPVLDRARQRGYGLGLPRGSAAEQAATGAIWRGDHAAVARLSARYAPPMQLVGKLYRHDGGWRADWTFVDGGRVLSQWSNENANVRQVMAGGADGAADALVERYAKAAETGPSGSYRITFTGIGSSDDFIRLSGYLQGMSVVQRVTPVRATPEGLELELELLTGLPGFRRLADERVLVETEVLLDTGTPIYRLVR